MRFTYDPDLYALDDGRVLVQFKSVTDFDKSNLRNDPYPNSGPTVRWEFKIVAGPNAGKTAFILTPAYPTAKNSCMRIVCGIIAHPLTEGEDVEMSAYYGAYYIMHVVDGKLSHQLPPMTAGMDEASAVREFNAGEAPARRKGKGNDPIPF